MKVTLKVDVWGAYSPVQQCGKSGLQDVMKSHLSHPEMALIRGRSALFRPLTHRGALLAFCLDSAAEMRLPSQPREL